MGVGLVGFETEAIEQGVGILGLKQEIGNMSGQQIGVHLLPHKADVVEFLSLFLKQLLLELQVLVLKVGDELLEVFDVLPSLDDFLEQFFQFSFRVFDSVGHMLDHFLGVCGVELLHLLFICDAFEFSPGLF